MNKAFQRSLYLAGFLAAFGISPARAAQPPDPTSSDANGNTAGGTNGESASRAAWRPRNA